MLPEAFTAFFGCSGIALFYFVIQLFSCLRIVKDYEQAVLYTLGKVGTAPKGPGLIFATEPWGIEVTAMELKSVDLPEQIQRAMGKQAEAEREKQRQGHRRRGRAAGLPPAAGSRQQGQPEPLAIQMRFQQTLSEIATEKNSTLIFPLPIELLRMLDRIGASKDAPKE